MSTRVFSARPPRWAALVVAGGAICAPALARAQTQLSVEAANQRAGAVDQQLAQVSVNLDELQNRYGMALTPSVTKVERRLRQGEVHFLLKDYLRASVALLDVVDDPSLRSHPRYDDCVFLLAESLRESRNLTGARKYYEQILPRAQGERLKDVVLGLLEVASVTGRFEDVDRYISYLRQAGTLSRPDVDYIYGKMLFQTRDPARVSRAYEVFDNIPTNSSVSARGAYYAGVALVRLGRYQEAIDQFKATLARIPPSDSPEKLRDLTHLSLGRLYQELGEVTTSIDTYQEISQDSPYFSDMLYEVAWAHVTAANQAEDEAARSTSFRRALQATELLMATAPDSRLFPQARILQGNLQIRLGASERAYDTFQAIIDNFGGAQEELGTLMRRTDPQQFFDELLAADLEQIDANPILPPLALTWAMEEDSVGRAVAVRRDLKDSSEFLEESRQLVDTLEVALAGEQRYNLFPGLREARSQAIATENLLLKTQQDLLRLERGMVLDQLTEPERGKVDLAHARVRDIEAEIAALPTSEDQVESVRGQLRESFQQAGRETHRLRLRVQGMRAQVVAVEKWYRDNYEAMAPEARALLERRLADAKAHLDAVYRDQVVLEEEIGGATDLVGGDAGRTRALRLQAQFDAAVQDELAILRGYRSRVPPDRLAVLSRIEGQRGQLRTLRQRLQELQRGLDARVEGKADEIRAEILAEVRRLSALEQERRALMARSEAMLGPVAQKTLSSVDRQFQELVLKADVGIIDVAWARKQDQTQKVNAIIQEQQSATRELELEFADVLRE